jgi:hypothetical protein
VSGTWRDEDCRRSLSERKDGEHLSRRVLQKMNMENNAGIIYYAIKQNLID